MPVISEIPTRFSQGTVVLREPVTLKRDEMGRDSLWGKYDPNREMWGYGAIGWTKLIRKKRRMWRMWVKGQRVPREWVSGYSKRQCSLSIHTLHTPHTHFQNASHILAFFNNLFLFDGLWRWLKTHQLIFWLGGTYLTLYDNVLLLSIYI